MSRDPCEPSAACPDRDDLEDRVAVRLALVAPILATHAGGIRLVEVSDDGVVQLRFTGMCTGCLLRPLTMANVVKPALADVAGVTRVEAAGTRVSAAAQARILATQAYRPT